MTMTIDGALAHLVRFHRTVLVLATVCVSVAASRIAADGQEIASWLLAAGGSVLMIAADLAREVNDRAAALATTAKSSPAKARLDVLKITNRRSLRASVAAGIALLLAAGVLYAVEERGDEPKAPLEESAVLLT